MTDPIISPEGIRRLHALDAEEVARLARLFCQKGDYASMGAIVNAGLSIADHHTRTIGAILIKEQAPTALLQAWARAVPPEYRNDLLLFACDAPASGRQPSLEVIDALLAVGLDPCGATQCNQFLHDFTVRQERPLLRAVLAEQRAVVQHLLPKPLATPPIVGTREDSGEAVDLVAAAVAWTRSMELDTDNLVDCLHLALDHSSAYVRAAYSAALREQLTVFAQDTADGNGSSAADRVSSLLLACMGADLAGLAEADREWSFGVEIGDADFTWLRDAQGNLLHLAAAHGDELAASAALRNLAAQRPQWLDSVAVVQSRAIAGCDTPDLAEPLTPLALAAAGNRRQSVRTLLELGADPAASDQQALRVATPECRPLLAAALAHRAVHDTLRHAQPALP